jgi:NitT/TauT family transport system permease protein
VQRAAAAARSLVVPVVILLAWEGISRAGWVTPLILPSPTAVAVRWWTYLAPYEPFDPAAGSRLGWLLSGELLHDALTSVTRIAIGFGIGAGLALPLGLVMGARPLVYELFNPVLQLLRPIPPIAYIPLAILWFGLGNPPAYFLISLGAFFPVLMNTIAGVRNMVPAAMPYILTGIRVGIGVAFIVVIVAEMIAVNAGLGYRILEAREYFWSDKVIAGMITIGICGLGIDLFMARLNGWLLRWHRGVEE